MTFKLLKCQSGNAHLFLYFPIYCHFNKKSPVTKQKSTYVVQVQRNRSGVYILLHKVRELMVLEEEHFCT